ncbi:hypothetical protein PHISCL_03158 [Aspergillus sclerotialis]|uniref:Uncharacterized protein n=1 Tax=Aspergillus sclerotialis TaxID=2070753 RepID=A0A3A2ZPB4_9EURO|nr:hypothetical protein PHISCL_03158 [Aspergillus sclerotialis]
MNPSEENAHQQSFQSTKTTGSSSIGGSFNSSRRVMKSGEEVVMGSDDDTDSIGSLEDVDNLIMEVTGPSNDTKKKDIKSTPTVTATGSQPRYNSKTNVFGIPDVSLPKCVYSYDLLVNQSVKDKDTEDIVAKTRAAFEAEAFDKANDRPRARESNQDMLISTAADMDEDHGSSRVIGAVQRTHGHDRERTWSFFDHRASIPDMPEFPRKSISPDSCLAILLEPASRERALLHGLVEVPFSKHSLPSELIKWLFRSVSSEPREDLRDAYARVFKARKHVHVEGVSCIRPKDVDELFCRLGAAPKALTVSEPIVPDPIVSDSISDGETFWSYIWTLAKTKRTQKRRMSIVLSCFLFSTYFDMEHTDAVMSSELKNTITTVLNSIPAENIDNTTHHVCKCIYDTVKDTTFQSRLLTHILPTSEWIALFRCRLAVCFLTKSPSPLAEPPGRVLNLDRIISIIKHDIDRPKSKAYGEFDYGSLNAITILLNTAIDSSWSQKGFPDKDTEREFNTKIDILAKEIKSISSSIHDMGTTDLNRPLAKSAMDALWFRVMYSIRSKRKRLAYYGGSDIVQGSSMVMDRFVSHQKSDLPKLSSSEGVKDVEIPIRDNTRA